MSGARWKKDQNSHLRRHGILVDHSLRQKIFRGHSGLVPHGIVVVAVLGLHIVAGQQDGSFGRAVIFHREDRLLNLQEEQVLRDLLDQLVLNVFREELRDEHEDARFFVDVLVDDFLLLLEPVDVAFRVFILQPEVPFLTQPKRPADLFE